MDEYLPYILTGITLVACFAFREARETPAWPILLGVIGLFHLIGVSGWTD